MALNTLIPVMSASALEAERKASNEVQQNNPVIQGLAQHVKQRWESAKKAKTNPEQRLLPKSALQPRDETIDGLRLVARRTQV
jgi:hypothetical protein